MAHLHGATKSAVSHAMNGHSANSMAHTIHGGSMMANMSKHASMAGMGAAAASAASTHTGKGLMSMLSKHPLLVFGLGMAAGYFAHKYRKEIIMSATTMTEQGKDFILNQRENLEDLVAECHEKADDTASSGGKAAA